MLASEKILFFNRLNISRIILSIFYQFLPILFLLLIESGVLKTELL